MPDPAPRPRNAPLVLIVRDGWGQNPNPEHDAFNAVKLARTPTDDRLRRDWPMTLIRTSGEDVGLPRGTMGNSEVGHQNIGAGRIVDQESVAITKACRKGLDSNAAIAAAITKSRDAHATLHLMGIASDAGVHGVLDHLYALLATCGRLGQPRVAIHLFTDGRDTGPFTAVDAGKGFVEQVEAKVRELGVGAIASVMGRFYAMDRDFRWERVQRAHACLTGHDAGPLGIPFAPSAAAAIRAHYDAPADPTTKGDEFVPPTMIGATAQHALDTRVRPGDAVVFYNYRGDRPREIVSSLVLPDADWAEVKPHPETQLVGFDRGPALGLRFVCMTAYSEALAPHVDVAFPKPPKMVNIGGELVSRLGLTQFRCAETEKFPHVTFFFNDYRDPPFPGETREIVQSPTDVKTYDQRPEMSAAGVRDAVLRRLAADKCESLLVVNFANADMVGHTGSLSAAIAACETVDACVGAIMDSTLARGGSLIVTADHGNAEQMWDPVTNAPHTAHTTYDVPLFIVGEPFRARPLRTGRLADLFPTALAMLGLPRPPEMTGQSLLA